MLALTTSYHTEKNLQKEKSLYKFIWVRKGSITLEIDHQEVILAENEVISLSNLQHLEFLSIDGEYLTVLLNSNFYCIYGNDHEVSCSGFLFNGSSHVVRFMLNESERRSMEDVVGLLDREFTVSDNLQEEMLRILLKRFIIQSTRIARQRLNITQEKEYSFEIIRQYYNLVDEHFRTKKQVQDYADLLHKSPKTLSNIFSSCKLPSPLRVIHERVEARHLIIGGGGYIGLEFASMYASFGSKVTVLEGGNKFIAREDRDIADAVKETLEKKGIEIRLNARAQSIQDTADGVTLTYTDTADGNPVTIEGDAILVATGRKPMTEGLNLQAAGVEVDSHGAIVVNGYLHTTAPNIWAMGDVKGGLQFTYISLDDYRIIRDDLFGNKERTADDRNPVAYSVFIDPPLSHVGLTEEEAAATD